MVEQGNEKPALFITTELNNIEESWSIIINANEKKKKEVNIFKTNYFSSLSSKLTFKEISSPPKHLQLQKSTKNWPHQNQI